MITDSGLLSKEDGGGYLIEFPDLPYCMSDSETIEDAIKNVRDAMTCWNDLSSDRPCQLDEIY